MEELKEYSLGDDDIQEALSDIEITTYPELEGKKSIDDVLDKKGRLILLHLIDSPSSGHWTALWKKGKAIHYFDSYGLKPEGTKKWLSGGELRALGTERPLLTELLRRSGYKVYYNTRKYQELDDDINTCGRHSITRLVFKDLSDKQYDSMIKKTKMKPDDFVSLFTGEIIGK